MLHKISEEFIGFIKSGLSMERASIFEAFWVLRVAETREMTFVQHGGVVSDH